MLIKDPHGGDQATWIHTTKVNASLPEHRASACERNPSHVGTSGNNSR
jgi:hypothetical protein